jgi:hypothetical protein
MKPFDVTIAFRKNIGRPHGPAVWQQTTRVERVFARNGIQAVELAEHRTGGRSVACVCLWDR